MNIKALILAAGIGSRLRPITIDTPKCLIPIKGVPLLNYWLEDLNSTNVNQVFINTHWLAKKVEEHLALLSPKHFLINTMFEESLLGSAGSVAKMAPFLKKNDHLLVIYADNFTTFRVNNLINFHLKNSEDITVGAFRTANPSNCGIIEIDSSNRGLSFIEKPEAPLSNLAACGLYIFNYSSILKIQDIVKEFEGQHPVDLGNHVMPKLIKNSKIYVIDEIFLDIGSHKTLLDLNSN